MSGKDFKLAIPYVAAIVERMHEGRRQILLQTRWKPDSDPIYSGTLEFPAGVLDVHYESVYDAVAREIEEESGLVVSRVVGEDPITLSSDKDEILGFSPFYCTQQIRNGKPWVGFVFLCEVEDGELKAQAGETKDPQWVDYDQAKNMVRQTPERFFSLELPALIKYFDR